jgi:hypothetical protein
VDGNGHLIKLVAENKNVGKQLKDALGLSEGGK